MYQIDFQTVDLTNVANDNKPRRDCLDHTSGRISAPKKRRTRGRNQPRPASRRYRWKEEIFGKGYPDWCALQDGPYRPHQDVAKKPGLPPVKT